MLFPEEQYVIPEEQYVISKGTVRFVDPCAANDVQPTAFGRRDMRLRQYAFNEYETVRHTLGRLKIHNPNESKWNFKKSFTYNHA